MQKFFIFIVALFCVGLSSEVFAAYGPDDYMIYTWGYADIMRNMLSALAGVMNSQSFFSLFKISALLGMTVISATLLFNSKFSGMAVGSKIVLVILFQVLLTSAPYDTYISDVSRTTGSTSLDAQPVLGPRGERVPAVVAFPLSAMSSIEKGLYDIFKDTLARTQGIINVQNQRTLPITTSLNLLLATSSYRITDINLNRSLDSFVSNCIVPDIISGYYDMGAMGSSANFFNEWQDVHAMRITNYYDAARNDFDGWIINCPNAYTRITADLNRATGVNGEAFKQIAGSVGLASDRTIHDQLGIISRELMDYNGNAQSFMRNAIAINSFNSTYASLAAQAGVNMEGLNYGQVKAQEVARMNSTLSAVMAKKYLPLAKGYLSVIFVAIIPLIMLIGLASGSFKKPIAMVVGLLVALSLWGVLEQLLDFIVTIRIGSLLDGTGGLTLANQQVVDMAVLDALSLSLGMYWMVPTLAFAIASMSGYAANSIMGGLGSSVMSGVGAAASEAAMGSRSMGVIRESMINTNKYDAARNDNMGVHSSDKSGANQSLENVKNTILTTNVEGMSEGMNWNTKNGKNIGEGMDKDGNMVKVTQYRGADGEWHNQEVKTTYSDGVNINGGRGENITLGAGATSTQYADGTTTYNGVSDKFGKVEATYGGGGELGYINGMKGHEYMSKHNSINEDMFVNRTNVSNDYTGNMMINGQEAFGKYMYDKDTGQGVFSGQIGGQKVDMVMDNVKGFKIDNRGEQNSLAHVNGDVGQMRADGTQITQTGNITEENHNVRKISGGTEVSGFNAGNAILDAGFSKFRGKEFDNAFFNNQAQNLNSIAQVKGDDKITTEQAFAAAASLAAEGSFGAQFFGGTGAKMKVDLKGQVNANLGSSASNITSLDFNRIVVEQVANGLDADKAAGMFNNSNGAFDGSLYDQAARDRYGALETTLKAKYDTLQFPGSGGPDMLEKIQGIGDKAMNAAENSLDKIENKINKGFRK